MAGLAIAGFWIASSSAQTLLASSLVGLAAFAVTGAAWAWLQLGPRETSKNEDGAGPSATAAAARQALPYPVWPLLDLPHIPCELSLGR